MTPKPEAQTPQISWRRLLIFFLFFLLLTAAGLYAVYSSFADKHFSLDMRLFEPATLISVAALLVIYFVADGMRLYATLRALGHRLSMGSLYRLVFINLFVSNVTPMATGGGVAQIWYLQHQGIPLGRATAATTIRTILAVMFIFSLTPFFLLTLQPLQESTIIAEVSGALALFVVLYLGFFAVVLFRTRWLMQPLGGLLGLLHKTHLLGEQRHRRWHFRMRRELLRFSYSFSVYLQGPKLWVALSVFFTALFLLALFSFPALLMYSLDYEVPYLTSLGLLVVTTFIMYFSPTPGASGISEGVFGNFFSDILSSSHLMLVTVTWRLVTIYLGMVIGLFVMHREILRWAREDR